MDKQLEESQNSETNDVPDKIKKFEDFRLKEELLKGILEIGWKKPSPVEVDCIPVVLKGGDMWVRAKNGIGRIGSYIIPILEKTDFSKDVIQAVVIVPTESLALRIHEICIDLAKHLNKKVLITVESTNLEEDMMKISEKIHIVIATSGRFLDLMKKDKAMINNCKILVLDEANQLLSQEFVNDFDEIIKYLPSDRQILLYSAFKNLALEPWKRNLSKIKSFTVYDKILTDLCHQFETFTSGICKYKEQLLKVEEDFTTEKNEIQETVNKLLNYCRGKNIIIPEDGTLHSFINGICPFMGNAQSMIVNSLIKSDSYENFLINGLELNSLGILLMEDGDTLVGSPARSPSLQSDFSFNELETSLENIQENLISQRMLNNKILVDFSTASGLDYEKDDYSLIFHIQNFRVFNAVKTEVDNLKKKN